MEKVLVTVEGAAEMLSLGRSKTWELVTRGTLPTVKIGRSTRVPVVAVKAYAERLGAEAEPATVA